MSSVNMQELFDRIRDSGEKTLVLTLEELIALETWLLANRGRRSFSEEQRAARGDMELRAKLDAERTWRSKLRHTASNSRALHDARVIPAALPAMQPALCAAERPSAVDRPVPAEGDTDADSVHPVPSAARTLADVTLDFWPDRIELFGEILAKESAQRSYWNILQRLRDVRESDAWSTISARQLATRFVPDPVQDAVVISAVSNLRKRINAILRKRGIDPTGNNVVARRREGYAFAAGVKIVSHDRDPGRETRPRPVEHRSEPANAPLDDVGVPTGPVDVPSPSEIVLPPPPAVPRRPKLSKSVGRSPTRKKRAVVERVPVKDRKAWVLKALRGGRELRAADVRSGLKIDAETADRLLASMRRAGSIEWVATPKPGHYRRVRKR